MLLSTQADVCFYAFIHTQPTADTCCVGHAHAYIKEEKENEEKPGKKNKKPSLQGCAAGGVTVRPSKRDQEEGGTVSLAVGKTDCMYWFCSKALGIC